MKKFILIGVLMLSTSAFAGSNILPLSPGVATNNVMFNNVVALQVEKVHPTKNIKKDKPSNKLEQSADEYFEGPLPEVIFTEKLDDDNNGDKIIDDNDNEVVIKIDPRESNGEWLEPKCACIGIDHIPFEDLTHTE